MNRARVVSAALVVSSLCAAIARGRAGADAGRRLGRAAGRRIPRAARARESAGAAAAAPPVDATLTRVDYDLRVDGDTVAGRALLTIDVLRDGWTRVQIPAGPDGARCAARRPAGVARRRTAAARAAVARRPRRAHARHRRCRSPRRPAPNRSRCPPSASPISRVGADAADERRRPVGDRRLHRRARGDRRREPVDGVRPAEPAADAVVEAQGRRSPRRAAAAHARARDRAGRARRGRRRRSPPPCASRCCRGSRARSSLALPPGLVVNQVNGATVADWDVDRRHAARAAARAGRRPRRRSSSRARRARRATARSPCRSCACRRPSAKPAASPSTSSAPARSPSAAGARPRAGRSVRARRHRRRPRVAVDGRVPAPAARGQRRRDRWPYRRPLHAAGRAHRQRRRGALSRAGLGRRTACSSRRATPSATTSAASSR